MSNKLTLKQVILCGRRRAIASFSSIRQAAYDMFQRDENLLDMSDFGYRPSIDEDTDGDNYDRAFDNAIDYYERNIDEVATYDNRRGLIYVYESKKGNYFISSSKDRKDLKKVKPNNKGQIVVNIKKEDACYNLNISI